MGNSLHFKFILNILHLNDALALNATKLLVNEDALLNFTELASKYGHPAEEYNVVTEDGYILGLFRIPGFRAKEKPLRRLPVLLMHGVLDSSDTWIIRGYESLAITLAGVGFDVWCGNTRGNKYSRRHLYLDPDKDPQFWSFTFDEHGLYDLRSTIDFVLDKTGAEKLNAIGHSQGNTIFYVLGSSIAVYNEKVNVLIALAPVCYLQYSGVALETLIKLSPDIHKKSELIGYVEVPGKIVSKAMFRLCSQPIIGYAKCVLTFSFPFTGADSAEFGPRFLRVSIGHSPTGTSAKNLYHFGQVGRRRSFSKYDYGPTRNLEEYGSELPPNYELGNVTMPIVLLVGRNDYIATLKNVALLRVQLPNVVEYTEIERPQMNHIDFVWGRTMDEYLFPHIFSVLYKYLY